MLNKAFVISCKESKYIGECVESIKTFYPNANIYIIDSCSNDKSYFQLKNQYDNLYIEDICNKNYEYGAYIHWFKHYGHLYDTYIFMQDSIKLNSQIKEIDNLQLDEIFTFRQEDSGWNSDFEAKNYFYDLCKDYPRENTDYFQVTIWNTFIIKQSTFVKLFKSKSFEDAIPPDNKILSRAWERIWTIIFKLNKISIKNIKENQITKIFGNRQ